MPTTTETTTEFKFQPSSESQMLGYRSVNEPSKESKLKSVPELPPSGPFMTRFAWFANDPSSEKLDLLRGVVINEAGEPHLMNVVHEAERRIHERKMPRGYQFPTGRDEFRKASAEVMFGKGSPVLAEVRNKSEIRFDVNSRVK